MYSKISIMLVFITLKVKKYFKRLNCSILIYNETLLSNSQVFYNIALSWHKIVFQQYDNLKPYLKFKLLGLKCLDQR
jgi:hypothetical protein